MQECVTCALMKCVGKYSIKSQYTQTLQNCETLDTFSPKATPIYLLVLHAQEVENEPFWNKKKSWKMQLFLFILFFLESAD